MTRILIVDDEYPVRAVLERILRSSGYEVATAENGLDGLREFRAHPADIVLIDIFMPVMDGIEMIQEIRREFPAVKSIAMSGRKAARPMLAVAKRLGIVCTLEKPFSGEALLAAVEKAATTNGVSS